jgi:hypothetical protein
MLAMSEKTSNYQLIVRQCPVAIPEIDLLLQTLLRDYGLDPYTARQRLIGPGLSMVGKGSLEKTGEIAALLQQHGFPCWLIHPRKPAFEADLLRSLEIHNDHILFTCKKGSVRFERGATVVGVLADLSGGLADKYVKRLLAQNAYRGSSALEVLSRDDMIHSTLQGQPVFDFYLLDPAGKVQHAVQVMPGRFDIDGLGARATVSSRQNLQTLINLVEEYAGSFRLHCDFGLSQLPRCDVKRTSEKPSVAMENLSSLSHYGWLVTQLQGDGRPVNQTTGRSPSDTGMARPVAVGQSVLGAMLTLGDVGNAIPGLDEVAREIQGALQGSGDLTGEPRAAAMSALPRDLPSPPDRPETRLTWSKLFKPLGVIVIGLIVAAGVGDDLFVALFHYGMAAGVVPAIAALGLLWSGFYFVRLKRRIENTPTSKVRSIAMGLVEVHGCAQRLYALVSPMTQAACVWYRLRKYCKGSNKNWKLVKEIDSNHVPFQIDDGTGRVVVDPAGASVKGKVQQTGYPGQSPLTFTAFGSGDAEDEKWVEDLIYEGTSLYVLGFAQPLREERMTLRDRTLGKLRQLKLDPVAMHRYDADGDGQVNEVEWDAARREKEQEALREHLAGGRTGKRQEEHVMIARGPRSLPFIIAEAVSENHLKRKYGLLSGPLLIAGVAATVLAIYKFLQYLRI